MWPFGFAIGFVRPSHAKALTMIIFIDEDEAYVEWLSARPKGFVVNAHRRPRARFLVLHRASCTEVSGDRRSKWTSGPYLKICSRTVQELIVWARDDVGGDLRPCHSCAPPIARTKDGESPAHAGEPHLTRVGEHLLSYLLELAVISLDCMARYADDPPTVKKLAAYFSKTVPQLVPMLRRRLEDGYIAIGDDDSPQAKIRRQSVVYPTPMALRTVPAFADLADDELERAVNSLRPQPRQTAQ